MSKRDIYIVLFSVSISVGLSFLFKLNNQSRIDSDAQFLNVANVTSEELPAKSLKIDVSTPKSDFVLAARLAMPAVVRIKNYDNINTQFEFESRKLKTEGSGVLISQDGYIATNAHVVNGAKNIVVELPNNQSFIAKLIGSDPLTDIALLKIEHQTKYFLNLGNSDSLQVGEWVIAVGNPYHLNSTVTCGIISALDRSINLLKEPFAIESFIQTDAIVNSGNSGGALVNTKGELIGLNTAIFTKSGNFEGYSFSIPSNLLKKILKDLKSYGKPQRGLLGIVIKQNNLLHPDEIQEKFENGVTISNIENNSSAKNAGLKNGDIILRINLKNISTVNELQNIIAMLDPGEKIEVIFLRDKIIHKTQIILGNSISASGEKRLRADAPFKEMGVEILEFKSNIKNPKGVIVHSVIKGSKAHAASILPGFVIQAIDQESIQNVDDFLYLAQSNFPKEIKGYYLGQRQIKSYKLSFTEESL